jgi:hypothetical protein
METLKDFLLEFGKKSGLDKDPEFGSAIASSLADFKLPPTAFESLSGLLNKDQATEWAKADLTVKNYHVDKFTSGYHESILDTLKEYGVNPEVVSAVKAEKSSGAMVKQALKAMNDKAEEIRKETGKKPSEEFIRQVSELQDKIKTLEAETDKRVNETKAQYIARMEKLALKGQLGFNWNENISEVAREAVYKAALDTELAKKGAKAVFNDSTNGWDIVQVADESLPLVGDNGQKLDISHFHSLALQNHKLTRAEVPGGNGQQSTQGTTFKPSGNGDGGTQKLPAFQQRAIDESMNILKEMHGQS